MLEDEPPRSEGVQNATGEQWRAIINISRKKEAAGPKQKVSVLLSINKVFEFRNQVYIPK